MNLFERLKRSRQLARLRRQVKRAPSPASYGTLAERYIAQGELETALVVAEAGLELFPNSERLAHVRIFAKKKNLSGQIRKLKQDLLRRPSPLAFTQLAQIYRELGNVDDALEIASECAERFPLNENPYLIQGEIRLERFLRDQIAKDAMLADTALRKVVRLNGHNLKAHLLLAETNYLVGSMGECRKHLRAVLQIMPTAQEVQEFLRAFDLANAMPSEEVEFEELAKFIEEAGAFANPPEAFPSLHPHTRRAREAPRAELDVESLKEQIVQLGEQIGVRNSLVLDREGEILADFSRPDSLSRRQFAELVNDVRDTADDASRRMDTGALVRAEIEGPTGNVTVVRVRNLTIAILYSDPLRTERVWEMLQDFIARNLTTSREAAHA